MPKLNVTKEEKAFNQAIDQGEYVSEFSSAKNKQYQAIAKNTFAKQKAVNVRISKRNLM